MNPLLSGPLNRTSSNTTHNLLCSQVLFAGLRRKFTGAEASCRRTCRSPATVTNFLNVLLYCRRPPPGYNAAYTVLRPRR